MHHHILFIFALVAAVSAQECVVTSNTGPRGENRLCPVEKPYCLKSLLGGSANEAFCSECNPTLPIEEGICDCPTGKLCFRNATNTLYGTCQPWPLDGQACASQRDCEITYKNATDQPYAELDMICLLGKCHQCDYLINTNVTDCIAGTKAGETRTCVSPGSWNGGSTTSGASSAAKGAALATLAVLMMMLYL